MGFNTIASVVAPNFLQTELLHRLLNLPLGSAVSVPSCQRIMRIEQCPLSV
jgi:hypothetical protein